MFIVIWKVVAEGGCRSKVLGGVYSWNQQSPGWLLCSCELRSCCGFLVQFSPVPTLGVGCALSASSCAEPWFNLLGFFL